MNREEIEKLKMVTMEPPIFATLDTVNEMRVKAQSIRAFGLVINGKAEKTPADKFLVEDLERRATRLEKEIIVYSRR